MWYIPFSLVSGVFLTFRLSEYEKKKKNTFVTLNKVVRKQKIFQRTDRFTVQIQTGVKRNTDSRLKGFILKVGTTVGVYYGT